MKVVILINTSVTHTRL